MVCVLPYFKFGTSQNTFVVAPFTKDGEEDMAGVVVVFERREALKSDDLGLQNSFACVWGGTMRYGVIGECL